MPRPVKQRLVCFEPKVALFKPAGIPSGELEENIISVEELEAVRLKDLEGLEQEDCSVRMGVSRGTFQRILGSARGKITDALVNGKALRMGGGHFTLQDAPLCQCDGKLDRENPLDEIDDICPRCPVGGLKGQGRRCRKGQS